MSENFPFWNPILNEKHFPRSADSEAVAVLAGQLPDGTIVPIQTTLVEGTTDQFALTVNTEITMPPITIGKVILQGTDQSGIVQLIEAKPNSDGKWSLAVDIANFQDLAVLLYQEVAQLSTVIALETQQVSQLSQITINTASGPLQTQQVTQLSTLEYYAVQEIGQLSDLNIAVVVEIGQLTTLDLATMDQITQLTQVQYLETQQVSQLSELLLITATEAAQLSLIAEIAGLSVTFQANVSDLSLEVTQLSVLSTLENGITVNIKAPNGAYYVFEGSQGPGTSFFYDFGESMQDIFLNTDKPIVVQFNTASNQAISLGKGQFDFGNQYAKNIYISTTVLTGIQIYANGGIA
jgi:hypothetical protein